ncbi:hypothetical protein [Bacillus sp. FJAT-27445]|uniref:hypothetical protein n=1 Tax=Bacillus sp. FJAT-27445 TaxID=1679166 RepID=UPI000B25958E|nr:hypothetical protein [Bacillus sp. FJAT-27445]
MDKKKQNTINIKLNNESRPVPEQSNLDRPPVIEQQSTEDIQPANMEAAAAAEASEEIFDWILPEEEPAEQGTFVIKEASDSASIYPKHSSGPSKRKGWSMKPAVLTVVFAIIVGVGLGAAMLKLLLTDKPAVTAMQPNGDEKPAATGDAKTQSATVQLLPISAFVIQEGLYSTRDSAEAAKQNLEGLGIPGAVLDKDGQAMLLIGIAGSIEGAKEIGEGLKEKGIAIYAKEITLPSRKAGKVAADEKQFLEKAPELFALLSPGAGLAMAGKEAAVAGSVKKDLEAINAGEFANPAIGALYNELANAVKSLESYEKAGDGQSAQAAQVHLLNFLAKYQTY